MQGGRKQERCLASIGIDQVNIGRCRMKTSVEVAKSGNVIHIFKVQKER